jgi:nucleoid-associated protein YgaU
VRADCKEAAHVRRENKLALIVGFSVLLVVAVLVSDHLSKARLDEVEDGIRFMADLPDNGVMFDGPLESTGRVGVNERIANNNTRSGGSRLDLTDPPRHEVVQPVYREQSPEQANAQRAEPDTPVEIYNGSGAALAEAGGMEQATGIDTDLLRSLLSQRNRPVLLETTQRSAADEPASTRDAPRIKGHVPRDNRYVVQTGDTLYEICERLYGDGTKWREVAAINEGKVGENGIVYVGIALDLPEGVRSSTVRTPPVKVSGVEPGSVKEMTPERDETRSYTVKKGDTLSQIVQREVGSVRHLDRVRALNPWLKDQKDGVRIGQKITLPVMRHAAARGR